MLIDKTAPLEDQVKDLESINNDLMTDCGEADEKIGELEVIIETLTKTIDGACYEIKASIDNLLKEI